MYFFLRALYIATVGILLIMCFNCYTGIVMFARYAGCDPILAGVRIKLPTIKASIMFIISAV